MCYFRLKKEHIKDYALGGYAEVAIRTANDTTFYKFRICKDYNLPHLYRIWIEPHNTCNIKDKTLYIKDCGYFLGVYNSKDSMYILPNSYKAKPEQALPKEMRLLRVFFNYIDSMHDSINVYHTGYCAKCCKPLSGSSSLKVGFGKICYKEIKNGSKR